MAAPTTKKTFRVSLTVDGRDCGVWETFVGGGIGGAVLKLYPGGMAPIVSLPGGTPTIDTITLTRNFDRVRDHDNLIAFLFDRAGKGQAVCKMRPLDPDGNGYGKTIIWTGTVSKTSPPQPDSASDDSATYELQIEPGGPVTVA